MANLMNRVRLHRVFLEKALGIHRDKLLPEFAATTFEHWAEREGRVRGPQGAITFEPVVTIPVATGDFSVPGLVADPFAQTLDLDTVSPQHPFFVGTHRITYVLRETMADWFQRNLGHSPGGGWLVPEIPAEWNLEFNHTTKRAVDTRLSGVTAQYLAAASYGPLQATLLPWLDGAKKTSFDKVMKVEAEPLYKLVTNWDSVRPRARQVSPTSR